MSVPQFASHVEQGQYHTPNSAEGLTALISLNKLFCIPWIKNTTERSRINSIGLFKFCSPGLQK